MPKQGEIFPKFGRELKKLGLQVLDPAFSGLFIGRWSFKWFLIYFQGGEGMVLEGLNFKKLDITTFSIEHNGDKKHLQRIRKTMFKNNYNETRVHLHDSFYLKLSK
jgi:hypothetical protein